MMGIGIVVIVFLNALYSVEGVGRGRGSFLPRTIDQIPLPSVKGSRAISSIRNIVPAGGDSSTSSSSDSDVRGSASGKGYDYNQTAVEIGSTSLSTLLQTLGTNPKTGLSSKEVEKRFAFHGPNSLITPPDKSLFHLILEQFDDRLVQILLVVAALSGAFSYYEMLSSTTTPNLLQSFVEPIIILSILLLNAIVGIWQSKSSSNSLSALKSLQPSLTTILRDGTWISDVDASQLVPGDVIALRVGDKVSADARILGLQTSVLDVDEGSLTGESVTVSKIPGDGGLSHKGAPVQDMQGVVFRGTVVTRGSGQALVIRTGMDTEMGKIQKGVTDAKAEDTKTPLGIKLDEFGEMLTTIIGVICLAVWLLSIPKFHDPSLGGGAV